MEGITKQSPLPFRRLLLIFLIIGGLLTIFRMPWVALVCWFGAGSIIYYTIKEPENAFALQEDERRKREYERQKTFEDALKVGGIIDTITDDETVTIKSPAPFVFEVELKKHGKTEDDLRRACENALNAMECVCVDVERIAPSKYRIEYSKETPIERAAAIDCNLSDLPAPKGLDALPVGIYPDGSPVLFNLDSRNSLIAGVPGSGKSVLLRALICGLLKVRDVPVRLVILSPKSLDFINFAPCARLIADPREMLDYLGELHEESEARKAWCIANGRSKITPADCTRDMPAVITIIDEFAVIKAMTEQDDKGKTIKIGQQIEDAVFRLVAETRFACFSTVIALQKASGASGISTDLRDLISGNRVSFATEGSESVKMVLGDYAIYAPCQDITREQAGVGYISHGDRPRVFKGAYASEADEKKTVNERGTR